MSERLVLIVEDDVSIIDGLRLNLQLEGFATVAAHDGESALELVAERRPNLVLLDINLPKMSGLEVLRTLRDGADETPIIVLSARQDESDKVAALRLGADDYVTKPFGVAELLARIDSALRRATPKTPAAESPDPTEVRQVGSFRVDLAGRVVTRMDGERSSQEVKLTHLEFELISFLVRNQGKVFSRKELLEEVWGVRHEGSARTVDNFIAQLRSKLEVDPNHPAHLVTVRGSGYRLDD